MASDRQRPSEPSLTDPENPEWTQGDFAAAKPARDVLPPRLFKALVDKGGRPRSAAPKRLVSLRLSPAVIEHFKAGGAGWQTRIDAALLAIAVANPPAKPAHEPTPTGRGSRRPAK